MARTIQQLFDLTGKTALVTGGSRGLGLQMAHALGEASARIMLTSRKARTSSRPWLNCRPPASMPARLPPIAPKSPRSNAWPMRRWSAWETLTFWSTTRASA